MTYYFKVLIFNILSIAFLSSTAQKLDFLIVHSGDTVGVLNVERKAVHTNMNYKLYSKVDVTFIVHLLIINNMTILYEGGKLISADVVQSSNKGVFDALVKTKYEKSKYLVSKNGKTSLLPEKEIQWSVARMYFEEPINVKSVFAEDNGKSVKLVLKSKGQYSLDVSFPSIFTYKNGQLLNMKAETIVGPIYFIRK